MGYSTDFEGQFKLDKPLTPEHAGYLRALCETRRMQRNPAKAEAMPDPTRIAIGLPIGKDGCYFVGGTGLAGQDHDASIVDYNIEPADQPGLWCKWIPTKNGDGIKWSGAEKFYYYVEWLQYLMDHFLTPWGYALSGSVSFQGERSDDRGKVTIRRGKAVKVIAKPAKWEKIPAADKEWLAERMREAGDEADLSRQHVVDSALVALGIE